MEGLDDCSISNDGHVHPQCAVKSAGKHDMKGISIAALLYVSVCV